MSCSGLHAIRMMTGALGLFLWELNRGADLNTARTMAVSEVVVTEMFYLFNSRYILKPVLSREGLSGNPYVFVVIAACAVLQIAYVHAQPLQAIFHSTHLMLGEWIKVIMAGMTIFAIAETETMLIRPFIRGGRAGRTACIG